MTKFPAINPVLTDKQHYGYFQALRNMVKENKEPILAVYIQGKTYVITHSLTSELYSLSYHEIKNSPIDETGLGETWVFERNSGSLIWREVA